ncbi:hypothetical protein PG5_46730 [Pseudomonas sp. G5(2012)]|nr:hypothetical protein PG5_46730 [Pseudomonas sp. G5(2012)]
MVNSKRWTRYGQRLLINRKAPGSTGDEGGSLNLASGA